MYKINGDGKPKADWPVIIQVVMVIIVVAGGYFASTIRIESTIAAASAKIEAHAASLIRHDDEIKTNRNDIKELIGKVGTNAGSNP